MVGYVIIYELFLIFIYPQGLVPPGKEPHLLVDGLSRDDIKQGILGDCWFLSSCAAVSQHECFMRKVSSLKKQNIKTE